MADRGTDSYAVSAHRRHEAAGLLPEWRELLAANPARNPLCDPDLQMAWCEAFVARATSASWPCGT